MPGGGNGAAIAGVEDRMATTSVRPTAMAACVTDPEQARSYDHSTRRIVADNRSCAPRRKPHHSRPADGGGCFRCRRRGNSRNPEWRSNRSRTRGWTVSQSRRVAGHYRIRRGRPDDQDHDGCRTRAISLRWSRGFPGRVCRSASTRACAKYPPRLRASDGLVMVGSRPILHVFRPIGGARSRRTSLSLP